MAKVCYPEAGEPVKIAIRLLEDEFVKKFVAFMNSRLRKAPVAHAPDHASELLTVFRHLTVFSHT